MRSRSFIYNSRVRGISLSCKTRSPGQLTPTKVEKILIDRLAMERGLPYDLKSRSDRHSLRGFLATPSSSLSTDVWMLTRMRSTVDALKRGVICLCQAHETFSLINETLVTDGAFADKAWRWASSSTASLPRRDLMERSGRKTQYGWSGSKWLKSLARCTSQTAIWNTKGRSPGGRNS